MKIAVIYARYSSDNQTEQSIEGQIRVCQQYANSNDIAIVKAYIDRAMTGTNDNRPDFQQMIKDSENKQFDTVLVYKLDRFSRNKYETAKYKKMLKDNGVKLISATENIPETPEGIILESLLEGMAEYYSAELSQKVKRGMNETRLKGNFTGGRLNYGYKLENRKIVIDEEQAKVVRSIFFQYSIGVFVKDILEELNCKGILNNGKPFTKNTIYFMLGNEKYSGLYYVNGKCYDNMYPQIVPTKTFNVVQKKMLDNKYGRKSRGVLYLLRHKIKCGYCGCTINAECGTSRTGSVKRYYKCYGRKNHNGCTKQNVRKELLESFVLNTLIKVLNKPDIREKIVNTLLRVQESQEYFNGKLVRLQNELNDVKLSIANLLKAIEQGMLNETTNSRMHELEASRVKLEKQITIEQAKTVPILTKEQINSYYIRALEMEPKLLADYLIKEIKLFDDRMEIQFNTPLDEDPELCKGLFVCEYRDSIRKNLHNTKTYNIKIYL